MTPTEEKPAAEDPSRFKKFDWILLISMSVYLVAVISMWAGIYQRTGGIDYTVDDAYIHGTLAKNIVQHGTFGIIPGQFASASSSLLWTFLMAAAFVVTGAQAWVPAIMATLFGALVVERCNSLLKKIGVAPIERLVVVVMALAYAPVLAIISTGMEHTLHAWLILCLISSLVEISQGKAVRPGTIFLWAALAAGARYESLFLLPPLLLWLAYRGKWKTAFELGFGMALPVVGFAAYSLTHGGHALPNSLMIKGHFDGASKLRALQLLSENAYLAVIAVLLVISTSVCFLNRRMREQRLMWLPVSALAMFLIHLQLARLGWFWRYEGYLIILGLTTASLLLVALRGWLEGRSRVLAAVIYLFLMIGTVPLFSRSIEATLQIVHAAGNIHDQQVQMAMLARHLGKDARIAVNDLGAVSFFADAHVLDLYGLGDNPLARAKHDKEYGAASLKARMEEERIDYVICYAELFGPPNELPKNLIAISFWVLEENLICLYDTVTFYGTSPAAAAKLTEAMNAYRAESRSDKKSTNKIYRYIPK
ncbi:MAG: hypothetical protein V4819_09875 [Verrucomicrobiota bacterium]